MARRLVGASIVGACVLTVAVALAEPPAAAAPSPSTATAATTATVSVKRKSTFRRPMFLGLVSALFLVMGAAVSGTDRVRPPAAP